MIFDFSLGITLVPNLLFCFLVCNVLCFCLESWAYFTFVHQLLWTIFFVKVLNTSAIILQCFLPCYLIAVKGVVWSMDRLHCQYTRNVLFPFRIIKVNSFTREESVHYVCLKKKGYCTMLIYCISTARNILNQNCNVLRTGCCVS